MMPTSDPRKALLIRCHQDHASLGPVSAGVEIFELPGGGYGCMWPKGTAAITKADQR